jgi:hypothetical protein
LLRPRNLYGRVRRRFLAHVAANSLACYKENWQASPPPDPPKLLTERTLRHIELKYVCFSFNRWEIQVVHAHHAAILSVWGRIAKRGVKKVGPAHRALSPFALLILVNCSVVLCWGLSMQVLA